LCFSTGVIEVTLGELSALATLIDNDAGSLRQADIPVLADLKARSRDNRRDAPS
jgi:hypothetical protein